MSDIGLYWINSDQIEAKSNVTYCLQIYLVYSVPMSASVRAKTYCTLIVLNRNDFRAVIDSYPDGEYSCNCS